MAKLKKAAAILAAAAVTCCSVTGCSDTSYTVKADDEEIRAGIYIDYMLSEMSYQIQIMYYYNGITEDYFDQEVDGQSLSDYLKESAMTSTKEYVAITRQFEALGLTLTDDELEEINDSVSTTWESYGDLYETEGISEESVKAIYKCSTMRDRIFDYYYAEGGTEEVSDDELQTYVNENYLRYKTLSFSKSTSDDEDTEKSENDAAAAERDEYLAMADGLTFEEFDTVIEAYNEAQEAEEEEESAESDESTDSSDSADSEDATDSTESTDESSESDDSQASDESSEASDDSEASDESSEAESSESTDSDSSDTDSSEEEDDPYENETMVNYGSYDEDDLDTDSGKLLTEINELDVGVAAAYENDSAYYIIIKGDVSERTDYVSDNRDSLLEEMKGDEFQEKIDEWVAAINFTENEKALKRYTPETVYEKQNEYYSSTT